MEAAGRSRVAHDSKGAENDLSVDEIISVGPAVRLQMQLSESRVARKAATDMARAALRELSVETANHSDDVVILTGALCDRFGLAGAERTDILTAARLHDVGKLGIASKILEKPGPLNAAEWKKMRQHTLIGERILRAVPELAGAATLVRHSHERWDGAGYPDGLAGEGIPLGSRIIFCADAFHAIRCDRPYRAGRTAAGSLAELRRCAGTQFDPAMVEALGETARMLSGSAGRRRAGRSNRLVALLLILALGVSGSALARSGFFPTDSAAASDGSSAAKGCFSGPACASAAIGPQLVGMPLSSYGIISAAEPQARARAAAAAAARQGSEAFVGGAALHALTAASTPTAAAGLTGAQGGPATSVDAGKNNGKSKGHGAKGSGTKGNSGKSKSGSSKGKAGSSSHGSSGSSPGKSGSAPGKSGSSPGKSGSAPGNSNGGGPPSGGLVPGGVHVPPVHVPPVDVPGVGTPGGGGGQGNGNGSGQGNAGGKGKGPKG